MGQAKAGIVDDRGSGQEDARGMLIRLRDDIFGGDIDETAVALGRTTEEIGGMIDGNAEIDDDLVMKIRGLEKERGSDSENDISDESDVWRGES